MTDGATLALVATLAVEATMASLTVVTSVASVASMAATLASMAATLTSMAATVILVRVVTSGMGSFCNDAATNKSGIVWIVTSHGHFDGPSEEFITTTSEVLQVCSLSPFKSTILLVRYGLGIQLAALGVKLVAHISTLSSNFEPKRFELKVNLRALILVQVRAFQCSFDLRGEALILEKVYCYAISI